MNHRSHIRLFSIIPFKLMNQPYPAGYNNPTNPVSMNKNEVYETLFQMAVFFFAYLINSVRYSTKFKLHCFTIRKINSPKLPRALSH